MQNLFVGWIAKSTTMLSWSKQPVTKRFERVLPARSSPKPAQIILFGTSHVHSHALDGLLSERVKDSHD